MKETVSVQLKGDKTDQEAVWWPVDLAGKDAGEIFRTIADGVDKKRTVLAALQPKDNVLQVKFVRVQLADSSTR